MVFKINYLAFEGVLVHFLYVPRVSMHVTHN